MNRLWVRLSLSFSLVLLAVLSIPIVLFWFAFMHRGPGRLMPAGQAPDKAILAGMFIMLILVTGFSLFVGVIAGILVSRGLSKQVTQMVETTQAINPNNLTPRVKVQGATELRELAFSFNRMVSELDESQKIRRNLLADVSHELLTPLTVLEGNLRAMLDGVYALDQEEISTLYDETHHMIALVKELRQITEAETDQLALQLEPTDLNMIVEETVALFELLAADNGVELRQVVYEGLPPVMVDQKRLRQVMGNLLSNALAHTAEGDVITIQSQSKEEMAQIIVSDTGEGLAPEELEQIFDRFYRTDNTRRSDTDGAGLGLAIVKALVEAHGGMVTAVSQPHKGTKFTISLPAVSNSPGS